MSTGIAPRVLEVLPNDAWSMLQEKQDAMLVDVRTRAEWAFVGLPDLSTIGHETVCVEWQSYPDMSHNPRFVMDLAEQIGPRDVGTILFLCRSGARSMRAAEAVATAYAAAGRDVTCINVATGFEGDLNGDGHRGGASGWKAEGLPWRQS